MSLRTKFAVLLGLLGLSVLLALGASWWAMRNMQVEVREPFRSMTDALAGLGSAKRSLESAHDALEPALAKQTPSEKAARDDATVLSAISQAQTIVEQLSSNEWSRTRVGVSTLPNLQTRLKSVMERSKQPRNSELDREIRQSLRDIHELIERTESRVVQDAQQALSFGSALERQLFIVLALCLLIAALGITLGLSLVRRWVLQPVAALRQAAARIGSGDFSHRVAVAPGVRDELAQLSVEVNTMAGMVKSLQDQRIERERLAAIGEMVRRLAHNLRNPLAGIRGLAEITRTDLKARAPIDSELLENQDRIITAVDRFETWLNELLGVTRPMQVLPVQTRVKPWLQGLIDAHTPQARAKGVQLHLNIDAAPEHAVFDARHLEHALSAMLSNAIEAASSPRTPPVDSNGPQASPMVRVSAQSLEPNARWSIQIEDNGPGIPADLHEKIFRPYFTTKRDGNGIGLAITLQAVQAHGGHVKVVSPVLGAEKPPQDSESGLSRPQDREPQLRGTRFEIDLPTNRPVLASESEGDLASIGQTGDSGGQNTRHRR